MPRILTLKDARYSFLKRVCSSFSASVRPSAFDFFAKKFILSIFFLIHKIPQVICFIAKYIFFEISSAVVE